MQIELQRQTGLSYVQQIKSAIAERIRSGLLEEGSTLPSVRQLAKQLSVSLMTVVQAYDELEKSGLIERIQGKGTYVKTHLTTLFEHPSDDSPLGHEKQNANSSRQRQAHANYQWQFAVTDYLPRAQVWNFEPHGPFPGGINLSTAIIDPDLLPHAELNKELEKALRESPHLLTRYGPIEGDLELRTEMARYHKERGMNVTAEDVLITSGVQQGIDLVARCFVGKGDVVIVEAPTYPSALDVFRGRGATIIPVPVDSEGMRLDILTALCDVHPPKIIYTIPTYHNPTGTVMSLRRRQQLLEIAESYHSLIIEDNPWGDLSFEASPPPPSLMQLETDGHVIHLSGFSKTIGPGCRIACLLAKGTVLKRLIGAKSTVDLGSPLLTQRAVLAYLRSKHAKTFPKQLSQALLTKLQAVLTALEQYAPPGVRWTVPLGGVNIWITLPERLRAEDLLAASRAQGISFLLGSACYPGEPEFNHLRISFANAKKEELHRAVRTLCETISSLLQQPRDRWGQEPIL
ncbi:GntR family transcriptional regulator [Tumebacillus sp. BK434]|uniref:MocR-like pyridoxine biosynthesis transcription factor PdxR n=1 Tax=Tumebacillus sp. BK434 TaxID=2512169 RepID=UPI001053B85A|nr:PLP-dependent aminotransferase family protein [Tumebacillus sp. BK434]TCP54431.1 GntR family transcriptional regulator [Tumebacillus sp. BK434]